MSRTKASKVFAVKEEGFHAAYKFAIARHGKGALSVVREMFPDAPRNLIAIEVDAERASLACNFKPKAGAA